MKKRISVICSVVLAAVLLLSAAGCSSSATTQSSGKPGQAVKTGKTVDLMANVQTASAEGKKADTAFQDAYLKFTAALLKDSYAASSQNRNVLLSPLSVMTALAMTMNGAEGETLAELEEVLTTGEKTGNGAALTAKR